MNGSGPAYTLRLTSITAAGGISVGVTRAGYDFVPEIRPVNIITISAVTQMTRTVSGKTINLRYVPGTGDAGFQRDATAANITKITNGYWLGETEVTQELYIIEYKDAGHTFKEVAG